MPGKWGLQQKPPPQASTLPLTLHMRLKLATKHIHEVDLALLNIFPYFSRHYLY